MEEGRHLWAMVYLLHAYFGVEGREEAADLLRRNSGSADSPRILGAFNEETPDWLSFFMFTYFTDRDGKYQLGTLKESGFDPLSRTAEFMLKEEAHHMFVGTTGVDRTVERTAQLMVEHETDDAGPHGGIGLDVIQKYLNFHYSVSAGFVRRGDLDQRGQLLHRRAQGTLAGGPARRRPQAGRRRRAGGRRHRRADRPDRGGRAHRAQLRPARPVHRRLRRRRQAVEPDPRRRRGSRSGSRCRTTASTGRSACSPPCTCPRTGG